MSAAVLSGCDLNFESFDKHDALQKCGEVFLEKQLGNLLYLCTLCDDRFKDVDFFLKHISDVHVSVESFIAFDPDESDEEVVEEEDLSNQDVDEIKETESVKNEYLCGSDDGASNHEEMFNIIDSADAVLDIEEVYEEHEAPLEVDMKVEEPIEMEAEELTVDDRLEDRLENPIEVEVAVSEVSPDDDVIDAETELDPAAEDSDNEILRSKIKCKYCDQQFDYVKDLRKHDCGLKKGKKLHNCTECGKIFKKKSGLDIHLMTHSGKKPHKCGICGTAYACKQNLIVHVRRHTGEKPFKCTFCDRAFASSTEKISHMRTHTGERPFVCDMCGKAHTSSSQLTEHMHRHLDIRNYVCEICEKRFRNSYNLRMHRLTHEDAPRKFSCEHCLAAFKTHSNLVQHSKIHLKEKKYVCKICGRAFAQHPGLYSHMKSHAVFK